MYVCVLLYAMKKRKRQHKGDCNTKIALKAWSKTTTMSKSLTAKKENKRSKAEAQNEVVIFAAQFNNWGLKLVLIFGVCMNAHTHLLRH